MLLVGCDDSAYQRMTNYITLPKEMKPDSGSLAKSPRGFNQAAWLVLGEIDLGSVTSDNTLRADADAREKHKHLLSCRVLRLIKNDKGLIEGASRM